MTRLYDKKGMIAYPKEILKKFPCEDEKVLIAEGCYCPNGHILIDRRASFNDFHGIVVKIKIGSEWGTLALSPIYKDKTRIVFGVEINKGDIANFYCPHCGVELPTYTNCSCGARVICLFLDEEGDFTNCIGICSRAGCFNAHILQDMTHVGKSQVKIQQGR